MVSEHTVGTDAPEEALAFLRLLEGSGAAPPAGGLPSLPVQKVSSALAGLG